MGVIEPSELAYPSPIVLVLTKDGTSAQTFASSIALRCLIPNQIQIEDMMTKVSEGRVFSKIDVTKGYWQILIVLKRPL